MYLPRESASRPVRYDLFLEYNNAVIPGRGDAFTETRPINERRITAAVFREPKCSQAQCMEFGNCSPSPPPLKHCSLLLLKWKIYRPNDLFEGISF